jgi:hypothetical protein
MVTPFALGDVVTLRKQHPCGGNEWRIERLGADIGIRCLTCSHYLMLTRQRLERGMKHREAKAAPGPDES